MTGHLASFPVPQLAGQQCVFVTVNEARRYLTTSVAYMSAFETLEGCNVHCTVNSENIVIRTTYMGCTCEHTTLMNEVDIFRRRTLSLSTRITL
jgi:hypothetical protein